MQECAAAQKSAVIRNPEWGVEGTLWWHGLHSGRFFVSGD